MTPAELAQLGDAVDEVDQALEGNGDVVASATYLVGLLRTMFPEIGGG